MGLTRTLSYDPRTKTREIFRSNDDGTFDIITMQDVEDVQQDAHDMKKAFRGPGGGRWKGDGFHKVAMVPMTVLTEWYQNGTLKDQNTLKKWVNDPANAVFRTRPGRI